MTITPAQRRYLALLLLALMAATRFKHPGFGFTVPDASWAVFFLAGLYLRNYALLFVFFGAAWGIDLVVTQYGGVSDWCMTPAYGFLLAAYGSLWAAGRWFSARHDISLATLPSYAAAAFAGTGLCFLISNASFYTLSGYFPDMSWLDYASRVAKYFPHFALTTLSYVAAGALVHLLEAYRRHQHNEGHRT